VPSLREIERTLGSLWLDSEARAWLLSGGEGKRPASLEEAPQDILDKCDLKGVNLYGGLISYGHKDVITSIFPYCCRLIGKKWDATLEDYLLKFPPDHYNLNRLCKRFPQYITEYGGKDLKRYPYLAELADFEWIELEKMEQDVFIALHGHESLTTPEQISHLHPIVNPTLTIRHYNYNVLALTERLESGAKPGKVDPDPTAIAIYRQATSHDCAFVELSDTAAKVVELSAIKPTTYQNLLSAALAFSHEVEPQQAVLDYLEMIEDLQQMGVFVGSI
jgi:hypothetical protein